jgi:hypothetical protein
LIRRLALVAAVALTLAMAFDGLVSYAAGHVVGYPQFACLVTWGGAAIVGAADLIQHRRWGR